MEECNFKKRTEGDTPTLVCTTCERTLAQVKADPGRQRCVDAYEKAEETPASRSRKTKATKRTAPAGHNRMETGGANRGGTDDG